MINPNEAMALLNRSGIVLIKWSTDPETSAIYISDNISQFGYSPKDFYEGELKDYWKFVHEDDRERAKQDVYLAREKVASGDENVIELSYRVRCKNGEIRWVEETILYDKDGENVNEQGFLRDVTHASSLMALMREASEKYNFLSENIEEYVFVIDRFDILIAANSSFLAATSFAEGKPVSGLIRHHSSTLFRFLQEVSDGMDIELNLRDKVVYSSIFTTMLSSGHIYVVIRDMDEISRLREHFDYMKQRDLATGLLNQNALEHFIRNSENQTGYRVVMVKVVDFKEQIQKNGFGYADVISSRVSEVIKSEFSLYDDNIFRSFEDEYVIFTRSPVNNMHIHNSNKQLQEFVQLEWGVSRRGVKLRELMNDARCNFRGYDKGLPMGSIFGFKN